MAGSLKVVAAYNIEQLVKEDSYANEAAERSCMGTGLVD